jgi:carbamoyltransferase
MKKHYIFPNPGDAGSAIGAAALITKKRLINVDHMFHGYELPLLSDNHIKDVVDILETGEAVGIAAGKAEFGPRALGNRSLLCDPRTSENKNKVNEIKKRQQYRPFAPSILEEHVRYHYKITSKCDYSYMQYVVPTKTRDFIATQHVDKSARVHVVSNSLNDVSSLRQILECWYERTGCPTLLNTSLNIRGMPMVNDEKDAAAFEKEYGVKVFCNG